MAYPTIEDYVGNTPLVRLQRLPRRLVELEVAVLLHVLERHEKDEIRRARAVAGLGEFRPDRGIAAGDGYAGFSG